MLPGLPGELALEWLDDGGATHVDRHGFYDFASAAPGTSAVVTVRAKNLGPGPLTLAAVDRLSGNDVFRLAFTPGAVIAAGETLDLNAVFSPPADSAATLRAFQAQLRLSAVGTIDAGSGVVLDLRGLTGNPSFTWSPATLDFGWVWPGTTLTQEITFFNRSFSPVHLTQLEVREGATPSTLFTPELTALTVPPARRDPSAVDGLVPGLATLRVGFRIAVFGPRAGQLSATTDFPEAPSISVNLRGTGGGGDIEVSPSVLVFGPVPYFAGTTPPSFAQRRLTVQNVGLRPSPADPRANLKLGQPDGAGGFARPYWQVRALGGSSLNEICVGAFDVTTRTCMNDLPAASYDPAVGLEATSTLTIPVRITPNGLGTRTFELSLFSNDSDEPVTRITVTADAVMLPPCDVEVSPVSLDFGVIAAPSRRELGFTVRNRLTGPNDVCHLFNLELLPETGLPPGMGAMFSLAEVPFAAVALQPGQSKRIAVNAWPRGPMPALPVIVVGKISFSIASPLSAQVELPLTATLGVPCLSVFPAQFDFGTVSNACSSPERTFQLFNTCSTDVVIDSASLSAAAGQMPGGPNCPGSSSCPEFFAVNGLAPGTIVPAGGSVPVTFSVKYRPLDEGADFGVFRLKVTENGAMQEYPVPLQGRGNLLGLNTEQFLQSRYVKTDVLFVIDDSSSMGPRQAALAQNVGWFLEAASLGPVDFQVGVTGTEVSSGGSLHSTAAGVRIVKPTLPNYRAAAAELMNVGTTGSVESCMEPATRALTAPYLTDPAKNAGFLREGASLHVICVTDARDQAPRTPAVYLNQLLDIKGAQRSDQFTYDVIGPFLPVAPAGCVYDDPNDGAHEFMIAQTGGVREEICTTDWVATLGRVGQRLFTPRPEFGIASRPDLAFPISVTIDGVSIPPVDPDPNLMSPIWNYDPIANAIIFAPRSVPEPGKIVTVAYRAICVP